MIFLLDQNAKSLSRRSTTLHRSFGDERDRAAHAWAQPGDRQHSSSRRQFLTLGLRSKDGGTRLDRQANDVRRTTFTWGLAPDTFTVRCHHTCRRIIQPLLEHLSPAKSPGLDGADRHSHDPRRLILVQLFNMHQQHCPADVIGQRTKRLGDRLIVKLLHHLMRIVPALIQLHRFGRRRRFR